MRWAYFLAKAWHQVWNYITSNIFLIKFKGKKGHSFNCHKFWQESTDPLQPLCGQWSPHSFSTPQLWIWFPLIIALVEHPSRSLYAVTSLSAHTHTHAQTKPNKPQTNMKPAPKCGHCCAHTLIMMVILTTPEPLLCQVKGSMWRCSTACDPIWWAPDLSNLFLFPNSVTHQAAASCSGRSAETVEGTAYADQTNH